MIVKSTHNYLPAQARSQPIFEGGVQNGVINQQTTTVFFKQ